MTYPRTIAAIERLEMFGIRLGLENVRAALDALDHPERAWPAIHVAGTNGKGTTAAAIAALASAHGRTTGLYLSPHLVDFRERIRIDGRPVDPEAVIQGWERVRPIVEERRMTYFEATTLIAFLAFAEAGVDLAVVETGLGGRLDATKAVEPVATVITNVARDHESHLGRDLAGIAAEKAGIFEPGVPAIVGERGAPEVVEAIEVAARRAAAPLTWLDDGVKLSVGKVSVRGTRFDYRSDAVRLEDLEMPSVGAHFADDVALAIRVWEVVESVEPARTREAVSRRVLGGRGEWCPLDGTGVLFDVAHNAAATDRLAATLAQLGGRWAVVAGILVDKPWRTMLGTLRSGASTIRLAGLRTAAADRRLDPRTAVRAMEGIDAVDDVAGAIAAARSDLDAGTADRILVTGSFHTVGEGLLALGLAAEGEPYVPVADVVAGGVP